MKFSYGLALALIFFEGFISQCVSVGDPKGASTSAAQKKLSIEELVNMIVRTGLNGTKKAITDGKSSDAAKETVKNSIIHLCPVKREDVSQYTLDGDNYLKISGVDNILQIFDEFGKIIKKVKVDYRFNFTENHVILRRINEIVKKRADQFTELQIVSESSYDSPSFLNILDNISGGGKRIQFPNVIKFAYQGYNGTSYDLNSIFPNLEFLNFQNNKCFLSLGPLSPMEINLRCMKNVKKLKELKLLIHKTYKPNELEKILKKNEKLSSFAVVLTDERDIDNFYSIENFLNTVETLEIYIDGIECLKNVRKDHQFGMPKLKRLHLKAHRGEEMIWNRGYAYFMTSLRKSRLIKIAVTMDYYITQVRELKPVSNLYDMKCKLGIFGHKLNMRMWVVHDDNIPSSFKTYKSELMQLNEELKKSRKPKWEINEYKRNGKYYMTFSASE